MTSRDPASGPRPGDGGGRLASCQVRQADDTATRIGLVNFHKAAGSEAPPAAQANLCRHHRSVCKGLLPDATSGPGIAVSVLQVFRVMPSHSICHWNDGIPPETDKALLQTHINSFLQY